MAYYTFVSSNLGAAYHFLRRIGQVEAEGLPTDKIFVLEDGNSKVVWVREEDVATYTIKAADDPRAANKILYKRPHANIISHNEFISLWEMKVGKTFERIHVCEEEVLKKIQVFFAEFNEVLPRELAYGGYFCVEARATLNLR